MNYVCNNRTWKEYGPCKGPRKRKAILWWRENWGSQGKSS